MTEAKRLNLILERKFGRDLSGNVRFQISWSDSQTEKRLGTYNVFYGSIYLRTEKGVREVPKYPYIKGRFVLERLIYHSNPELPISKISYEPIYIFESSKGESLPLNEKVAIIVCHTCLNPNMSAAQKKAFFEDWNEKEFDKEVKYFEDAMDEGSVAERLHDRDGIILNPFEKKEEQCKTN